MYIWRIEELKTRMAARPLSDREVLPYLVVFVALTALSPAVEFITETTHNIWDGLGMLWSVSLAVAGTVYIYHRNGGARGQHFLQRYLAVGWVVAVRFLVGLLFAATAFHYAVHEPLGASPKITHWYDFLFLAVFEVMIVWRIGHHVRTLAERTSPLPLPHEPLLATSGE